MILTFRDDFEFQVRPGVHVLSLRPAQAAGAGLAPVRIPVQFHKLAGQAVNLLDVVGDDAPGFEQASQHPAAGAIGVDQQLAFGAQKLDLLPELVGGGEGEGNAGAGRVSHAGNTTGGA